MTNCKQGPREKDAERHVWKWAAAATVRTQCFYPKIKNLTAWLGLSRNHAVEA